MGLPMRQIGSANAH